MRIFVSVCVCVKEQTIVSISSSEGFSPGSHSGEGNHHGAAGRGGGLGKRAGGYEEEEEEQDKIPWVLIPITGLSACQGYLPVNMDNDFSYIPVYTSSFILSPTTFSKKFAL